MERKIFIQLIYEFIRHNQLLDGLYEIGLSDNQHYGLYIASIVTKISGNDYNVNKDDWLETKTKTMMKVHPSMNVKEQASTANRLFEFLSI